MPRAPPIEHTPSTGEPPALSAVLCKAFNMIIVRRVAVNPHLRYDADTDEVAGSSSHRIMVLSMESSAKSGPQRGRAFASKRCLTCAWRGMAPSSPLYVFHGPLNGLGMESARLAVERQHYLDVVLEVKCFSYRVFAVRSHSVSLRGFDFAFKFKIYRCPSGH